MKSNETTDNTDNTRPPYRDFLDDLRDNTGELAAHGYTVTVTEGKWFYGVGALIVPNVRAWPNCCGPIIGHLVMNEVGEFMLVPADKSEVCEPKDPALGAENARAWSARHGRDTRLSTTSTEKVR